MTIDRSYASRTLAKAIAYKASGNDAQAEAWARELIIVLECATILKTDAQGFSEGRAYEALR